MVPHAPDKEEETKPPPTAATTTAVTTDSTDSTSSPSDPIATVTTTPTPTTTTTVAAGGDDDGLDEPAPSGSEKKDDDKTPSNGDQTKKRDKSSETPKKRGRPKKSNATTTTTSPSKPKRGRKRKLPTASTNSEGTTKTAAPKRKRQTRRKTPARSPNEEAQAATAVPPNAAQRLLQQHQIIMGLQQLAQQQMMVILRQQQQINALTAMATNIANTGTATSQQEATNGTNATSPKELIPESAVDAPSVPAVPPADPGVAIANDKSTKNKKSVVSDIDSAIDIAAETSTTTDKQDATLATSKATETTAIDRGESFVALTAAVELDNVEVSTTSSVSKIALKTPPKSACDTNAENAGGGEPQISKRKDVPADSGNGESSETLTIAGAKTTGLDDDDDNETLNETREPADTSCVPAVANVDETANATRGESSETLKIAGAKTTGLDDDDDDDANEARNETRAPADTSSVPAGANVNETADTTQGDAPPPSAPTTPLTTQKQPSDKTPQNQGIVATPTQPTIPNAAIPNVAMPANYNNPNLYAMQMAMMLQASQGAMMPPMAAAQMIMPMVGGYPTAFGSPLAAAWMGQTGLATAAAATNQASTMSSRIAATPDNPSAPRVGATNTRTRSISNQKWEEKFKLLQEYRAEFGDCNVQRNVPLKYKKIVYWVGNQRSQIRKKSPSMTEDRKQRLLDLGLVLNPRSDKWEEKFDLLCQYKEEHGDFSHLEHHAAKNEEYKPVLTFAKRQLEQLIAYEQAPSDKKAVAMTSERRQKLLGLGLCPGCFRDVAWEEKYALLKQYKQEHGNCNVRADPPLEEKYKSLASWVARQRQEVFAFESGSTKRTSRGPIKMTAERRQKLVDLDMSFSPCLLWEEKFELLKQYKEEHGHCRVPTQPSHPDLHDKYKPLQAWFAIQRTVIKAEHAAAAGKPPPNSRQKKPYKMTEEQKKRFLDLGVVIYPSRGPGSTRFDIEFDKKLVELNAYKEKHGNLDFPNNSRLSQWAGRIRRSYVALQEGKKSTLTNDHIVQLAGIGFSMKTTWKGKSLHERVRELVEFVKTHGRFPVREAGDPAESRLQIIADKVRTRHKLHTQGIAYTKRYGTTKLPQDLIDALDSVGFRWKPKEVKVVPRKEILSWDERFEMLKAYKEKHGHCEPPRRHPKLGYFCKRQRKQYKNMVEGKRSTLTLDKFRKLSDIGFRFKMTNVGLSRQRYVDGDSSGYDTTDEEGSGNEDSAKRKRKINNSSNGADNEVGLDSDSEDEDLEEGADDDLHGHGSVARIPNQNFGSRLRGIKSPRFSM